MSVPPRTERDQPRITGRREKPDKLGLAVVAIVLVALAVAVVVLLL